jgi:prepilin peptidase CpaA
VVDLLLNAAMILAYFYAACVDFSRWRITNLAAFALLACSIAAYANNGFDDLLPGLLAGTLLFGVAFPFWLARQTGAGDVKLLAVTGFVIGMDHVLLLAVLILVFFILMLLAMSYARHVAFIPAAVRKRLADIRRRGRVPYGVPISLAAISVLSIRLIASW